MFIFTKRITMTELDNNIELITKLLSTDVRKFTKKIISDEDTEKILSRNITTINDLIRSSNLTNLSGLVLSKIEKELYLLSYCKVIPFVKTELNFLPTIIRNTLHSNHIYTLKKLASHTEKELQEFQFISHSHTKKIKSELRKRNLRLSRRKHKDTKSDKKLLEEVLQLKKCIEFNQILYKNGWYQVKQIRELHNQIIYPKTSYDLKPLTKYIELIKTEPRHYVPKQTIDQYKSIRLDIIDFINDLQSKIKNNMIT